MSPVTDRTAATGMVHSAEKQSSFQSIPMPNIKALFKRHLPARHDIHGHRYLKFLGERLHDPFLWHLNRNSAAGGLSVGLFMAFIPIPIQMVLAAFAAIALRVNLPVAVLTVWVTNPLTMAPIFLFAYRIGAWMLDIPARVFHVEMSFVWLIDTIGQIWQPLLLGCFVLSTISAIAGNILMRLLWRLHLVRRWRMRKRGKP